MATPQINPLLEDLETPQDVIHKVSSFWKIGKKFRERYSRNWRRFWRLYMGDHWDIPAQIGEVKPKTNLVFSSIETLTATITANKPRIIVVAREPRGEALSNKVQKYLDYVWDKADMDFKLPILARELMITGNSFFRVYYNQMTEELDIDLLPAMWVVVEPSAMRIEDAQWIIVSRPYSYDKIKMLFPDETKDLIAGMEEKTDELIPPSIAGSEGMQIYSPVVTTTGQSVTVYSEGAKQTVEEYGNMVKLTEAWLRYDLAHWDYILIANNIIIKHEQFEMTRPPIVHFGLYRTAFSLWAVGDVQQVYEKQLEINKRSQQLLEWLKIVANPPIVIDPASGFESDTRIRAGTKIPVQPAQIAWLQPPSLPAELLTNVEMNKKDIEQVLGNPEILQGIRPAGIESGKALQNLYEFANVRVLSRVRIIEAGLKELAEILIENLAKHYPTHILPKTIMNFEGAHPEYVELDETDIHALTEIEMVAQIAGGSLLPTRQTEELQLVMTLFQLGLISGDEVLKRSGLDNWVELAAYYRKALAQQAQTAAQQQQGRPA